MDQQRVYHQIRAILESNQLAFAETPHGCLFLRFASAAVTIDLVKWGTQTVVQISADVLTGIDESREIVLYEVNRLNTISHFGRWVFYEDSCTIAVEYELLGDHLQENELMTGLAAVARLADHHDNHLQKELGGQRA